MVVHDGRSQPVAGLKAEDFRLLEDGKEQPIALFAVQSDPSARQASAPQPANVFNNRIDGPARSGVTVILFDRLNTAWAEQGQARAHIIKYLSQLRPDDRVGLYLLESSSIRILHDFTRDASSLLRALDRAQAMTSREVATAEEPMPVFAPSGDAAFDAATAAWLARVDEIVKGEALKNRAQSTIAGLEAIARHLAGVRGRKNLIWISSGFPMLFSDGLGTQTMYKEVNLATRAINDADISIYPVDARGLVGAFATPPSAKQQVFTTMGSMMPALDSMRLIADQTGGRAYFNTNDLGGAIARAVDDSRLTYVLGYYPSHDTWDGRFREIEVKVRRPGVDVRHRKGYLALPMPPQDAAYRQNALVDALGSPLDATGLDLAVEVQQREGSVVVLGIRLGPGAVTLSRIGDRWEGRLDLAIAQMLPDRRLSKTLDTTVPLGFDDEARARILREGFSITHKIVARDDMHQVRVAVRDELTGAIGTVTIPADRLRAIR